MKRNKLVDKKLKRDLDFKILKIGVEIYQCAHKFQISIQVIINLIVNQINKY